MKYPRSLENGDIIGITAPSMGITGETDFLRADNAKRKLEEKGFKVIETSNVRTMEEKGRSSSKEQRAKEFMELWKDEKVKSIILARWPEIFYVKC